MKKNCCVLFIAFVIMLGTGGCDNTERPSPTQSGTPSTPAPSAYTESALGDFHISLATDELSKKYDSFHEYINDEGGARLIIWPDTEAKDFAFISISIRQEDLAGKLSYFAGDTLFLVDELSPEKPFVVDLLIPGAMPAYGISFVDENGVEKYYIIQLSGRGAEEAPPYFFLEFENGGGILPVSP
ncbi:MAG: hypothetical protein VB058_02765 [Oscillospiraceae bacterium]|nr:hypothetical protein [Oscillospiraceae bacterium]